MNVSNSSNKSEWHVTKAWVTDYQPDLIEPPLLRAYHPVPSVRNHANACKVSTKVHTLDASTQMTMHIVSGPWNEKTKNLLEKAKFTLSNDKQTMTSQTLELTDSNGNNPLKPFTHVTFNVTYVTEPDGKKKFTTTANWLNPNSKSAVDVGTGTSYPWKEP